MGMNGKNGSFCGEGGQVHQRSWEPYDRVSFLNCFNRDTKCGQGVYSEGQNQAKDLSASLTTGAGLGLQSKCNCWPCYHIMCFVCFFTFLCFCLNHFWSLYPFLVLVAWICTLKICSCITNQDVLKSISITTYLCFNCKFKLSNDLAKSDFDLTSNQTSLNCWCWPYLYNLL